MTDCGWSPMTINERLFALKLFPEFDQAVAARNRSAIIDLLQRVHLSEADAAAAADAVLRDPARFGF
jgi:hypothetical protein